MLFATLIVLAALVPAFFIQGEAGAFLPSIVITYVLAVAVSMLVALMVTPALSVMLLANAPLARRESPVVRLVQGGYTTVAGLVARPRRALVVFGAVVVVGLVAVPFLDLSLRPSLRERDVLVRLDAPPGTSLSRMDEIAAQTIEELRSVPGVADVGARGSRGDVRPNRQRQLCGDLDQYRSVG